MTGYAFLPQRHIRFFAQNECLSPKTNRIDKNGHHTKCAPCVPVLKTTVTRRIAPEGLYFTATGVKTEEVSARFIPYFAFANRGATEMQVWVLEK